MPSHSLYMSVGTHTQVFLLVQKAPSPEPSPAQGLFLKKLVVTRNTARAQGHIQARVSPCSAILWDSSIRMPPDELLGSSIQKHGPKEGLCLHENLVYNTRGNVTTTELYNLFCFVFKKKKVYTVLPLTATR